MHSLTAVGETLLAAGGWDGTSRLKSVELLRPGDGETAWTLADWSLVEEVSVHCAVARPSAPESELVVIGGIGRKAFRFSINGMPTTD